MSGAAGQALMCALLLISVSVLKCQSAPLDSKAKEGDNVIMPETEEDILDPDWLASKLSQYNDSAYEMQADGRFISHVKEKPRLRMFYSRGGYHLLILTNGTVTGTNSRDDKYAIMQVFSIRSPTVVAIKGVYSEKYLAMDKKGNLYGTPHCPHTPWKTKNCHFSEALSKTKYNTYFSVKYPPKKKKTKKQRKRRRPETYYVGLGKDGKPLTGPQTRSGRNSVLFLPRPLDDKANESAKEYLDGPK
ncbi:fibroblast growth factor 1-like [Saccoglossus kowalevskii]|uniref:Fibroblast growth factor 3-like n=1 Tax=Saccoglossus kowalevskii TaxID=10224 RepID=A0ABM0MS71_SACKO|nr:PREDICTED: fibroblast growth factor 3-like [Saccoglossus kowalevskii]